MDEVNINLKSRLSEILDTLNLIIFIYSLFLIILGISLHNSEVVIQACIMIVVYIIFQYINYDLIIIMDKGIRCEKYGFIYWEDMYITKRNGRTIYIYSKNKNKPYKFIIKKTEDNVELDKAYKYIFSKVNSPEKLK